MSKFKFGRRSESFLTTCELDLQTLGWEAIRTSPVDFSCTEGHRDSEEQALKYQAGLSKVKVSLHEGVPSRAVHFDPYPIMYPLEDEPRMDYVKKYARYYMLAMHILLVAQRLGLRVRWGGDWDGDFDILDQTFDDLAHWELR